MVRISKHFEELEIATSRLDKATKLIHNFCSDKYGDKKFRVVDWWRQDLLFEEYETDSTKLRFCVHVYEE